MVKLLNFFTAAGFYGFVTFAPINWVTLVNVGGLSVKYMHLAIVPIFACLLFKSFRYKVASFVKQNGLLIGSFILLLFMNFVATYINSTIYAAALPYIVKNFSYCIYFILFGAVIYFRMKKPGFEKEITYSNTVAVFVFTITASLIFHAIGRNFLGDMAGFFLKGDSVSLRYDLFKTLFNTNSTTDAEIAANLRNTLIGAFIYIHFSSQYAFKNVSGKLLRALNIICIVFSAFFILASVSRSNILVLAVGYFIFYMGEILVNRNGKKLYQLIILGFVGITFLILFWTRIENAFSDSTAMISGRLGEIEDDARWALNAEAFDSFTKNFLTGKGSGAVLSDGHSVHNFILGSAYQAGVFGLILSLLFYFGIIGKVIANLRLFSEYHAAFFIVSLIAIPLLRTMESGNAGTLSLVEWFCLGFIFAFLAIAKERRNEFNKIDTCEVKKSLDYSYT